MAEAELEALKKVLCTQQQLLQKLYVELEAEREASSTAANEALSMILRLQGEKAAEKLEASQYKRVVEEKMKHNEELMASFDELMHQKEMEIASLEFQAEAYRYKLLSFGVSDSGIGEMRFRDYLIMRRDEAPFGDLGGHGIVKRNKSLPAIQFKDPRCVVDREGSMITLTTLSPRSIDEDLDYEFEVHGKEVQEISEESAVSDISTYWEQIRQLDVQVKELSNGKVGDEVTGLRSSLCSAVSGDLLDDPIRRVRGTELDYDCTLPCSSSQAKDPENFLQFDKSSIPRSETKITRSASQSMRIHDIFEVPQNSEDGKLCQQQKQEGRELVLEGDNKSGKPDPFPHGTVEYCGGDEAEWVKKALQYVHHENKWSKPNDGVSVNCHLALVDPTTGVFPSQTDVQQLNKRLEQLEGERKIVRQEVSGRGEEELKLLKEIHEQLKTIRSEIRSIKTKKPPPEDDPSLVSIMEAMFFYSL